MKKSQVKWPLLEADDIDVKIGETYEDGSVRLMLYKNARVDRRILDAAVGVGNWRQDYEEHCGMLFGNLYLYLQDDDDKHFEWIKYSDCGSETDIEKEKGWASDAFKRACFAAGLGTELYSVAKLPTLKVEPKNFETEKNKDGSIRCADGFKVEVIKYNKDKEITELVIRSKRKGNIVYQYPESVVDQKSTNSKLISAAQIDYIKKLYSDKDIQVMLNSEELKYAEGKIENILSKDASAMIDARKGQKKPTKTVDASKEKANPKQINLIKSYLDDAAVKTICLRDYPYSKGDVNALTSKDAMDLGNKLVEASKDPTKASKMKPKK